MGECVGESVGQWVGSAQITKNLITLDLIEIIQFCLKAMICRDTPAHGWMHGWLSGSMGGSGQITKNLLNINLIEIIQFYLKIYDL